MIGNQILLFCIQIATCFVFILGMFLLAFIFCLFVGLFVVLFFLQMFGYPKAIKDHFTFISEEANVYTRVVTQVSYV